MNTNSLWKKHPAEYWNHQVVLLKNAAPFFLDLPNAEQLVQCLTGRFTAGRWVEPSSIKINASRVSDDGSFTQMLSIGIEEARKAYNNGFSLCFGDLSNDFTSLAELKNHSSKIFGYPELIAITGYLSPRNAIGVLHFDRQHNFFIQVEGSKRWFVSERPAIKNPYDNLVYAGTPQLFFDDMRRKGYEISVPKVCGNSVYELEVGDVLYIPPGYYHSPETISDASLHYTLTIEPACFWGDFNNRFFEVMLANNSGFLNDYRFMTESERREAFNECLRMINRIADHQ